MWAKHNDFFSFTLIQWIFVNVILYNSISICYIILWRIEGSSPNIQVHTPYL